ncbi:MAG: bifunctional adenosylcobinamide kinase/adenosylcobinamide-phosphate guanylyltransferase [Oscillospiraceae bacterium]|nr:bifunctional adenosylcobinamide kinase/adenosylcobinamide-phosphate guanylyltransferase [Oscillospiraceae bacterium]
MTTLITGGSKCGKSRFAESLLLSHSGQRRYLATMQPFGADAERAIARHREMRAGKGLFTIEQYTDLHMLMLPPHCGVLLECLCNLTANEMFRPDPAPDVLSHIMHGIRHLQQQAEQLVIVTGQVGSDGIRYPAETNAYIALLGAVSRETAALADTVYECVYGIPVLLKGAASC